MGTTQRPEDILKTHRPICEAIRDESGKVVDFRYMGLEPRGGGQGLPPADGTSPDER